MEARRPQELQLADVKGQFLRLRQGGFDWAVAEVATRE